MVIPRIESIFMATFLTTGDEPKGLSIPQRHASPSVDMG